MHCRTRSWTQTADGAVQTSTAEGLEKEVQTEIEGLCRTAACCIEGPTSIGKPMDILWFGRMYWRACIGEHVLERMYWRECIGETCERLVFVISNVEMFFLLVVTG